MFHRVGEDVVFHLLTETSIFASLPNGCLCQMTGDPVLHLKPPIAPPRRSKDGDCTKGGCAPHARGTKRRCVVGYCEERPPKRPKHTHPTVAGDRGSFRIEDPNRHAYFCLSTSLSLTLGWWYPIRVTPADVAFQRARMFYSRPSFVPHTAKIIIGMPPKRKR